MSAALAHTDQTLRVHRAYNGVRKSRHAGRFLAPMHALYLRACITENLTDADDMLLQHVEMALASDNTWSGPATCNSIKISKPQLRLVPTGHYA